MSMNYLKFKDYLTWLLRLTGIICCVNRYELLKIHRLYNMVARADWDTMLCCYGLHWLPGRYYSRLFGCRGDKIQNCLAVGEIIYRVHHKMVAREIIYLVTWLLGR